MRELSFTPKDWHSRESFPSSPKTGTPGRAFLHPQRPAQQGHPLSPELPLLLGPLPPGSVCTLQAATDSVYSLWSPWLPPGRRGSM